MARIAPESGVFEAARAPASEELSPAQRATLNGVRTETDPARSAEAWGRETALSTALEQRFDRIETALQALQSIAQLLVAELRTARPAAQLQDPLEAADKMLALLKQQLAGKDHEIARLRHELSVRERLVGEARIPERHPAEHEALAGWEIVGRTDRNAALQDPSGRTHVIAVGEPIAPGVQLLKIDPAANRVITSGGELSYPAPRGASR